MTGRILLVVFCSLWTSVLVGQSPKARQAYEAAMASQAAGKHAEAVAQFTDALTTFRNYPAALRARAMSYSVLGQDASALADLDQALAVRPDDLGAWNLRGDIHLRKGDLNAAASDFTHVLGQHSDPMLRLRRGTAFRGLGKLKEARQDLDLALQLKPGDPEALYQRGLVSGAEGNWAAAEADLNTALERNPDFVPAYLARGLARQNQGNHRAAIVDFSCYMEHAPKHGGALVGRAQSHAALGDKKAAETDLKLALSMDASDKAAEELLAEVTKPELKPEPVAVQVAEAPKPAPVVVAEAPKAPAPSPVAAAPAVAAPAVAPSTVPASVAKVAPPAAAPKPAPVAVATREVSPIEEAQKHHLKGRELNTANQFALAVKEFDIAIKLNPQHAQALNSRGYSLLRLRRRQEAVADFNRAIELQPEYKNAYHNRAMAKRQLGDAAGADADEAKAATLKDLVFR